MALNRKVGGFKLQCVVLLPKMIAYYIRLTSLEYGIKQFERVCYAKVQKKVENILTMVFKFLLVVLAKLCPQILLPLWKECRRQIFQH